MNNPIINGLTAGAAFLLSFLLFFGAKNNNYRANRWLGIFMVTLAGAFLEIFIHNLSLQNQYPYTVNMLELFRFLTAPALYLGIQFFTIPNRLFHRKDLWHFAPFLLFFIFRLFPMIRGYNWQFSNSNLQFIVFTIIKNALIVQYIIYWVMSYQKLQKHRGNIKKINASVHAINLDWLQYFLIVLAILVVYWLNLAVFNISFFFNFTPYIYLLSIIFLARFALQQREIYPFEKEDLQEISTIIEENCKLEKTNYQRLSDSEVYVLKDKLNFLMQYEKVFLDNELNLPQLAKKMAISPQDLSYLINNAYQENFFSYINRHRVEEVKRLLLTEKHKQFNVLGIAYSAGFNSKATFNAAFKKQVGISPSEYVKSSKKLINVN